MFQKGNRIKLRRRDEVVVEIHVEMTDVSCFLIFSLDAFCSGPKMAEHSLHPCCSALNPKSGRRADCFQKTLGRFHFQKYIRRTRSK